MCTLADAAQPYVPEAAQPAAHHEQLLHDLVRTSAVPYSPHALTPLCRQLAAAVEGLGDADDALAALWGAVHVDGAGDADDDHDAAAGDGEAVPTWMVSAADAQRLNACEDKCAVCLDGYDAGQRARTLPCAHTFHADCVGEWLNTQPRCPVCKTEVD